MHITVQQRDITSNQLTSLHDANVILSHVQHLMCTKYGIHHATIQIEPQEEMIEQCHVHSDHEHQLTIKKKHCSPTLCN
jgi:hypothetical protein